MRSFIKKGIIVVIGLTIAARLAMGANNNNKKIGVMDGQLAPLPTSPNAVASYAAGAYPQGTPLQYSDDMQAAQNRLVAVLNDMPRSKIEKVDGNYVHATFRSRLFRFVDDVEFLFDDDAKIIHYRSAARTGYGDMNVNGNRIQSIREAFEK